MKVLNNEKNQGILTVCISMEKEEFDRFLESAYLDHADRYHVSGYAYGLVPREKLEEVYGPEVLYQEALALCTSEVYKEFIKEQQIRIIGRPQVKEIIWPEEGGVTFTVTSELYPEISLGQYKGIETALGREENEDAFASDVLVKAIGNMEAVLPEVLLQQRLDYCISEEFYRAYEELDYNLTLDAYLTSLNLTQEQWKEQRRKQVYEMTQLELLLNEVAVRENLQASGEELEQEYYYIADQNEMELEEAIAAYDYNLVKEELLREKARLFILDHAVTV